MKHLNQFVVLLVTGSLACTHAAHAQSPWRSVTMPTATFGTYNQNIFPAQMPVPGMLWALRYQYYGLGSGESQVISSGDGGTTWQTSQVVGWRNSYPFSGEEYVDLCAFDASRAWIVSRDYVSGTYKLLRTTAGVAGFAPVAGLANPRQVRFTDANTGLAVCDAATGAVFYRTTDGGTTWTLATTAPALAIGETVRAVPMLGGKIWLTTSTGRVLTTDDAGQTWGAGVSGFGATLKQVTFRTHDNGLALSTTGQLAATTDGGLTWLPIVASGPLRTGVIAGVPGTPGTYLSGGGSFPEYITATGSAISTDEGRTWQSLESGFSHRAFVAAGPAQVWALGRNEVGDHDVFARYQGPALATRTNANATSPLYPNPSSGRVYLTAVATSRRLAVYDGVGRIQRQLTVPAGTTEIDLSGLPAGNYHLMEVGSTMQTAQRITIWP
ncbi:T9SS type A sorting domain-containing protein [Hymenobacter ruber]